jgi:hypothetical protein
LSNNFFSYSVCIWDPTRHPPLPTSDDDALAILERLSKVPDTFNPLLADLTRALVDHLALPSDPQTHAKALKAFWGADPRQTAAACTTAVLRLALPDDAGMEQLAPLVQAAAKLGLVVYDDEDGMCFLPDGTIYPEDMREIWQSDLADLLAGPPDPNSLQPDNRTLLQTIAYELFNALGQGNKRIS